MERLTLRGVLKGHYTPTPLEDLQMVAEIIAPKPFTQDELQAHQWHVPDTIQNLSHMLWRSNELSQDANVQRLAACPQELKDDTLKVFFRKSLRGISVPPLQKYQISCCLAAGAQLAAIEKKFTAWLAHKTKCSQPAVQDCWQSLPPDIQKDLFAIIFLFTEK